MYSSSQNSKYLDDKSLFLGPQVQQYGGSHMVMTDVMKPSKKKLVNLDTRFGMDTMETMNVSYYGKTTIVLPERISSIKSVWVRTVEIPMTFPNFAMAYGNQTCRIYSMLTETWTTVMIPDAYYTSMTSILETFQQQLQDKGIDIAVTMDTQQHVSIQNITMVNDTYVISWYDPKYDSSKISHLKQSMGYIFGFRSVSMTLEPRQMMSAMTIMNMNPLRYMYLLLDEVSNQGTVQSSFMAMHSHNVLSQQTNILARLPLDPSMYSYGSILVSNPSRGLVSEKRIYPTTHTWHRVTYQWVNEWGQGIPFQGFDSSCVVEIEYE